MSDAEVPTIILQIPLDGAVFSTFLQYPVPISDLPQAFRTTPLAVTAQVGNTVQLLDHGRIRIVLHTSTAVSATVKQVC